MQMPIFFIDRGGSNHSRLQRQKPGIFERPDQRSIPESHIVGIGRGVHFENPSLALRVDAKINAEVAHVMLGFVEEAAYPITDLENLGIYRADGADVD